MWFSLLVALACEAPTSDSGASAPVAPQVAVGTGDLAWEALAEDAELTMVHGPQGGWHMLGSVRTWGMDPIIDIHFTIRALELDGALVSDGVYRVMSVVDPQDATALYYPGMYGYLAVDALAHGELDTPPELLSGQRLALRMDVSDSSGLAASDEVVVIAAPDPDDLDLVPSLAP